MVCSPLRRRAMWMLGVAAVVTLVGCEKPVIGQAGASVEAGGVAFTVNAYDVRMLELTADGETFAYPTPVLVIPVTITNKGQDDLNYSPTHTSPQMSETATPLLYKDPGAEAKLPPESKATVQSVILSKGALAGQQVLAKVLKPGESVEDLLLFQVPPAELGGKLILSLPPTWHRGKVPVLVRMDYAPREATGPRAAKPGEAVAFGKVTFTVNSAQVAYIKLKDSAQGDGYSKEPLLRIDYTVSNGSEEGLSYEPNHRTQGAAGARLSSDEGSYSRVQFGASAEAVGQVNGKQALAAGGSVKDFVLFELPGDEVKSVVLEVPASLFGAAGIARVKLPYDATKPALPEEMKKPDAPK
jgi:hypothetical protein